MIVIKSIFTILVLSLASLMLLSACNNEVDSSNYFPLNKGLEWKYRTTLITKKKQEQGRYTVTNIGTTKVDNEVVNIRRTDDGRDYYLIEKSDGIYRYASRTLFETHPDIDDPPRLVLPTPFLKSLKARWSSKTTRYTIHRIGPSTVTNANSPIQDFVMSYSIVSQNETVMVPAGRFENCLLVEGEATLTLFVDPHIGYQDIPITTREWYAPGVGLVKLERVEPLDTRVYNGGRYLFELMSFTD